ncbi:TPA: thiolase family protein [Candidatus Woesearchaeota archaeon]|nr:MAG: Acetyl-CoA acetyltransferase [archaeon GW2011_AR11]MBS3110483.1 thiolase family protein [Candidatus Woesearchaeota archaeon]HIH04653.1 thiolase family protein [Candidatus Woesearchaeota archaeon]HIH92064.1 thiolase family protein [Candidatus Woesearchaeota archaeon]HII64969.1 thiolase family protein [Candidatus Woesearchaeota archaeon]
MFIRGAGMSVFDVESRPAFIRVMEAVEEALDSSGLGLQDIDAVFVSNSEVGTNGERQRHVSPMLSTLFQRKMPIINVPAGCGGGGTAVWNAIRYSNNSSADNVLVIGYDILVANIQERVTDEMLMGGERIYEQAEGMIFPAQNALVAQQYMMKNAVTEEDFALVALKNHENAFLNPKARFYGRKVTMEMIMKSPVVASPLRLFDCSIPCNGAAALVVSREQGDVEIAASAVATGNLSSFEREEMTSWGANRDAAAAAYRQAGVSPGEVSVAELHDAFTPVELMSYEDLGFCEKGKGAELIRNSETVLSGRLPVNTSGGLKAKGHPISATGVSQLYELVLQLRGEAGKRQVSNARCALAHNIGGAGSTVAVHILRKAG